MMQIFVVILYRFKKKENANKKVEQQNEIVLPNLGWFLQHILSRRIWNTQLASLFSLLILNSQGLVFEKKNESQ